MSEFSTDLAISDGLGLPLYGVRPSGLADLLQSLPDAAATQARLQNFTGEAKQILLVPNVQGYLDGALLGLGTHPALHGFGVAATSLPPGSQWHIEPGDYTEDDAALGFLLGAYRFDRLKAKSFTPARLAAASVPARARIIAKASTLARDLINTPANLLGPAELANAALQLAEQHGAHGTRITGTLLEERYPALAAVGAGSDRAPEIVILKWQGSAVSANAPLISLCGKGVCFDTGGYDLKPSSAMIRMKKDMGGAAILLGLASAIMSLDLPIKLIVRIGCVENSVSGHAMRPSDVLRTRSGLTVEVGNTDAEGRLVLCDLLAEAAEDSPDWLIDAATLTGAARVALGPDLPALFCSSDEMADIITQSGITTQDRVWRLPLHDFYATWLDSYIADINNISTKSFAGAIVAALFLQRFVPNSIQWAHIDVYAWNDATLPGRPEGGEAQSLRALLHAIETFSAAPRPN
jgi:leucyl aminopeptidase